MAASGSRLALAALALPLALAGCTQFAFVDDGTSVSWGLTNDGVLINGARLPTRGEDYWMPPRWAARGLHYGTDELASLVIYASREVAAEKPGPPLGVGNLSPRGGGPSRWHGSHQSGRDVDLLFYARAEGGERVALTEMVNFDEDGEARYPPAGEGAVVHFDVERNWLLVRSLVSNPIVPLQWIFVAEHLKDMMLAHAIAEGEPLGLILKASYILHQPTNAPPHADHFHVRTFCPVSDRSLGCRHRGWLRWAKKGEKYPERPGRVARAEAVLEDLVALPVRSYLAFDLLTRQDALAAAR